MLDCAGIGGEEGARRHGAGRREADEGEKLTMDLMWHGVLLQGRAVLGTDKRVTDPPHGVCSWAKVSISIPTVLFFFPFFLPYGIFAIHFYLININFILILKYS